MAKKGKKAATPKKGSVHLVDPKTLGNGNLKTICGETACNVLTWARKTAPAADNASICTKCRPKEEKTSREKAIEKRDRKAERNRKFREKLDAAGEKKEETPKEGLLLQLLGKRMPSKIESRRYKGSVYHADVRPDGIILLDGKEFNSPSAAARSITENDVNGWIFWHFKKDDGKMEQLGKLRRAG